MAAEEPAGLPGEPAEAHGHGDLPLLTLAPAPLLWRGAALAGLAAALGAAGVRAVRASLLLLPAGLVLGAGAVLAAWAAAIHITGGERFDDGGCD
ncbi:hypothetical protein [Tepidiforma bonchosmolovskayae]|jgi:hypothetical protein|uniref:Uncharacterized protein n=1 Tax=Tepidiforma bonchosmolovskayae TaxID=2601677 RepID=A0ABX6C2K1_9CHLR|nr:hypothetical protein [Tepidiforma bonchosmolovskayae]QFG03293.1 hypothetical protein Tbon_08295 [Tepidiforma bonchosmolovskayae]